VPCDDQTDKKTFTRFSPTNSSKDPLLHLCDPPALLCLLAWREAIPRRKFKVVVGGSLSKRRLEGVYYSTDALTMINKKYIMPPGPGKGTFFASLPSPR